MALMKKLAYCVGSKTHSIDIVEKIIPDKIEYKVIVKTGDTAKAGTDADVRIQLIGKESETKPTKLDNFFRDDFERGRTDKFTITMKDVGDPLLCKLVIKDKGMWPDWYVEYIEAHCNGRVYFFPVYEWVHDGFTTAEGRARLPSPDEHQILASFRQEYLKQQRSTYRWRAEPEIEDLTYGLNGHLQAEQHKDLPRNAQWSAERDAEFHDCRQTGLKNLMLNKFLGVFRKFDNLDEVSKLLLIPSMKCRKVLEPCWYGWKEDREFAREQLNGCRPRGIERVNGQLPVNFPVTDAMIKGLLPSGKSLASEIAAKRVFMIDNSIMDGIECGLHPILKTQNYTCAPYLLLYCNEEGYLMPLGMDLLYKFTAIQLFTSKCSDENPIWTPNDVAEEWLLAKMFFNNSNGQLQQVTEHLMACHLINEPFIVSVFRNFSSLHPLRKLMLPHIPFAIALNTIGREMGEGIPGANTAKTTSLAVNSYARGVMISPGGTIDRLMAIGGGGHVELLRRGFKKFDLDYLNLPEQLKKRGVDDPNVIKEYGYREDGLKYWAAIKNYVRSILDIYYQDDDAIRNDNEVQNWIGEVGRHGFTYAEDAKIPKTIDSLDQLELLLTSLIFASSVQHAAEGNPMFDIYGNPPNHPVLMRQPPPQKKGNITMETIMNTLPDQDLMCAQMAVSFTLSMPPADEVFLGEFPMKLFTTSEPLDVLVQFTAEIKRIGLEIEKRNQTWSVPYEYLLPENVPCRIDM